MEDMATSSPTRHPRLDWRALVALNVLLGALLWFMDCTDYSWANTIADELFGLLAFVVACMSLSAARHYSRRQRWPARLACLPSLLEGGMQLAVALLLFVPPFTLGGIFLLSEVVSERQIQQAVSPDGRQVAGVYFRSVGSYTGGNGHIYVRIHDRLLPFVERDVYSLSRSYASGRVEEYLRWQGNDTLYITETKTEVKIGPPRMDYPLVIKVPRVAAQMIAALAHAGP